MLRLSCDLRDRWDFDLAIRLCLIDRKPRSQRSFQGCCTDASAKNRLLVHMFYDRPVLNARERRSAWCARAFSQGCYGVEAAKLRPDLLPGEAPWRKLRDGLFPAAVESEHLPAPGQTAALRDGSDYSEPLTSVLS